MRWDMIMIKAQTNKKDSEAVASAQQKLLRENDHASITSRPNIDEISKRNEEAVKQERKSFYTVTGIIVLLIIVAMLLVYFFR